jgi:hypothetical protein
LIDGFLHPGLAWGALLAVVPLVIHLLNRRRHRPLAFGAMRFVALAYKRTRRRALLEDLLLLLLRTGAVALLALALARPLTRGEGLLGPLTEARRNLALIVDASASTGQRLGVQTAFERILARARERVAELDGDRGDRVLLVWGDDQPRLLSWRGPEEALALLSDGQIPSDGALELGSALGVVEEALASELFLEDGAGLELVLLCDGQRGLFEAALDGGTGAMSPGVATPGSGAGTSASPSIAAPGPAAPAAAEGSPAEPSQRQRPAFLNALDRLAQRGLSLSVEDLAAGGSGENATLAELALVQPPRGPGLPIEFTARVEVRANGPRPGARLALFVDGARAPVRTLDLPAEGAAETAFSLSFDAPGVHLVEASLEADGLAIDDRRALVVDVPRPLRILGVNGAPDGQRIENDELGFFRAVLTPPEEGRYALGGLAPFEFSEVDSDRFALGDQPLSEYDLIVLANLAPPSGALVEALAEAVRQGTGLLISLGDRTGVNEYRERLFDADGGGLLPGEPLAQVAVPSRRDGYFRVASFDAESPVLAFFGDERWRPYLTEVPVFEFIEVRPLPDARVLASLDERSAPLLIERRLGLGRVLLFTSTLDAAWTRLPESPKSFVPLVHELCFYAARRASTLRNVPLGQPLRAELPSFPRAPELVRPDGSRSPLANEPTALGERRWALELAPAARRVGVWRLELEGQPDELFSVGFDPAEGRLERLGPAELSSLHPALAPYAPGEASRAASSAAGQSEWWRALAALCLLALLADALLSGWLSFRRGGPIPRSNR